MKIKDELKNLLHEEYRKDTKSLHLTMLESKILFSTNEDTPQVHPFAKLMKYFLYPAVAFALFFLAVTLFTKNNKDTSKKEATNIETSKFAHFQYLPKPEFQGAAPSSLAAPNEYRVKGTLPSAEEVVNKSKISRLPIVYAASPVSLPVYRAKKHEFTASDAAKLAETFGISGDPKREGYEPPGYYGFLWEDEKNYFMVDGGSGTGGFEYYLKVPTPSAVVPTDEEAGQKAKEFLTHKGLIDDTYILSGVGHNLWDISKRSGFREDHKDVYFRKKLEGYQVYDWHVGQGSPIEDKIHVMVGGEGRILYVSNEKYWTSPDLENKTQYTLKEPMGAFEDLKAGRGKLAWLDYDAVGIDTSGVGPIAPDAAFTLHGKLRDVEIESVDLAYYHQPEDIATPEYYQPIYIFKAQATLDWKDDYAVEYEGDKLIQGKRTEVVLVAPAISEGSFFNNTVTLTEGHIPQTLTAAPVYYPQTVDENKGKFTLKLGTITPLEDPKRNVYLSWEDVKDTITYNIYLKVIGEKEFNQVGYVSGSKLSETISVNKYIDYQIKVQACQATDCVDSNEVFLSQDQKPTFYLKLGTVTPREDPKSEVYLSWAEYPGTAKYNVYLRNSQTEAYQQALEGIGGLSYTATINRHNDNYFIIQACNDSACYPSNEVFLPKE